jgi:ferredoxin/coenzyme F420-reducing hydrogenase delta subunit
LDWLPIFGSPTARNFLAPSYLDDRFFTLMVFIHIALPLVLLFVMWFHINRVSSPKMNAPRGLAVGTFLMLLALSLIRPAESQGIANLAETPSPIGLDWFYLWVYPLIDAWNAGPVWVLAFASTLLLILLPWLPPRREKAIAKVDLDNCNGCTRCAMDCPYGAIAMKPRSDGKPFEHEAVVDPTLCVACGICAGACPTSTPFRRASALVPGIDLAALPLAEVRERAHRSAAKLTDRPRVLIFGCDHAMRVEKLRSPSIGAVSLACTGQLPPSFVDYVLSRKLAEGVVITGCREGECAFRFGPRWTEARLTGERDPQLRERVPRERIARLWAAPTDWRRFTRDLFHFRASLAGLDDRKAPAGRQPAEEQAAQ